MISSSFKTLYIYFLFSIALFVAYQGDAMVWISDRVKECSTPKLMSISLAYVSGSLDDLNSLTFVAEGMVVAKFKVTSIINVVICLLEGYYGC